MLLTCRPTTSMILARSVVYQRRHTDSELGLCAKAHLVVVLRASPSPISPLFWVATFQEVSSCQEVNVGERLYCSVLVPSVTLRTHNHELLPQNR